MEQCTRHASSPVLDRGEYPTARSRQTALEALHGPGSVPFTSLERGAEDQAVSYLNSGGQRWEYNHR